jgi:hypothetical protein
MAEKRMFSLSVVDTDWFLDLPLSTQALYFHLNMRADDDGFVDAPNSIVRKIGASKNDFDLLVAKRYVLKFESGIIVIKHWRMHNTIQKDRYHPTQFQEELKTLSVKENKSYTDSEVNQTETQCIQSVSNMYPKRIQNVSLGLDLDLGLDKDLDIDNKYLGQKTCEDTSKKEELFESFWKVYPRKIGKEKCKNWFKSHKPKEDLVKQMIEAVEQQKKSKQWSDPQYIPHPYTWLNQGRWEDELTPAKDSTFQSAPKNPIQWEEAKANTIDDDISLIKNNPDKAQQLLYGIERINPERAKEIRRILGK